MNFFDNHIDDIRNKRHFWTKVDVDNLDWNTMMPLIDTHPEKLHAWNRNKQRVALNSFHQRPSAPRFAKEVFSYMKDFFVEKAPKKETYTKGAPSITNIAFIGFGQNSDSYPRHADNMDVFLVQAVSEIKITIGYTEKPSEKDDVRMMRPGDAVWLPRGTWHQLEPKESRITFSFGFESDMDTNPADFI
jgi:mannose-6-phosphate isomerase-like protein (cupin superfamily)